MFTDEILGRFVSREFPGINKESIDLIMQTAIKLLKAQGRGKTLKMLKNMGDSQQDGGGGGIHGRCLCLEMPLCRVEDVGNFAF
jgi:hypothetical protein